MSSAVHAMGLAVASASFCVFAGGALTGLWTLGSYGVARTVRGLTTHADVPDHFRSAHYEPAAGLLAPMGHVYEPHTIG